MVSSKIARANELLHAQDCYVNLYKALQPYGQWPSPPSSPSSVMFRGKHLGAVSSYNARESMDDARATSDDTRQSTSEPTGTVASGMNAMINGITFVDTRKRHSQN